MNSYYEDLISVIVPVYNAETFLEKCVSSIQAQTYTNLEIILINDGSSDSSGAICDSIAEKDSRVRVKTKKNGGVASARNLGLDEARGEYIAFVDHDDTIDPDMYERMYKRIKETDSDICICGFKMIYSNYERIIRVPHEHKLSPAEYYETMLGSFRKVSLCFQILWNKLIRRDLISHQELNYPPIRLNEETIIADDVWFSADISSVAEKGIVLIDFTPYKFDRTNETLSIHANESYYSEKLRVLEHWKKRALSVLPHRADKIEQVLKCQIGVGMVINIHVSYLGKRKPPIKLTWSVVSIILQHSDSKEEKISALLIYFLPAPIYRVAYKLYCKATTIP